MANYIATTEELTAVADAIRAKGGTSEPLVFPEGFVSAIGDIQSGGGGMPEGFTAISTGKFSLDADKPNFASSSGVTFQHDLGVIPDIIIVYKENDSSVNSSIFISSFCVIDENAYKSQGIYNYRDGYGSNKPVFSDKAIKNITESSATVTSNTEGQFRAGSYRWVAVKF